MPHDTHVIDGINKDLPFEWSTRQTAKDYYLDLAKDWEDPYGDAIVKTHDGVRVVRDDLLTSGSKVRGGDCLISSLPRTLELTRLCMCNHEPASPVFQFCT